MKRLALVAVVLLAGCSAVQSPASAPSLSSLPALREGGTLSFGAPVVAIQSCGLNLSKVPCSEPSVVAGPAGFLVVNNFIAPFARSTDGATFVPLAGPGGAAFLAGGDGLVQAALDGSAWWSILGSATGGNGLRVAHSGDAGLTWDVDTAIALPYPADRQWLAFGDGVLLLTYQGNAGVHALASTDGGRTWSAPVAVQESAHIHGAAAWCGGRFLVPLLDQGTLKLAASPDGRAWALTTVPGAHGAFFPALACSGNEVQVAWRDFQKRLQLVRSPDLGATWEPNRTVSLPGERLSVSPWLAVRGNATWLAYFTADADATPAALRVLRLEGQEAARGVAASGIATTSRPDRPGNTDFAFFAFRPDGRVVLPYADGDGAIRLVAQA